MHLVTVTHVLAQLGRTPGADGDAAGGAEDVTTAAGTEDPCWTGADDAGITEDPCWTAAEDAGGAAEDPCETGADDAGGATIDPCWTGADDAGAGAGVDATGATHFVQTVEIEVVVIVETVVVTCWIGVPLEGVTMLVTGQVVRVV